MFSTMPPHAKNRSKGDFLVKLHYMKKAIEALNFIIPIIEKYKFQWLISGGFASLVYGVKRKLTDIDIDVNVSKNDLSFKKFMNDVQPYITQKLKHATDENYDSYNLEITYNGQVIDICPIEELKIFNKSSRKYEPFSFYKNSFPKVELISFHGLTLPLLPKKLIIENKKMLTFQRLSDHADIAGLENLIKK